MKVIPGTFTLLGKKFSVVVDNRLKNERKIGLIDYDNGLISLQSSDNNQKIRQAFVHEVVHAILFAMCDQKLATDEQFVDIFSAMLEQIMSTMEGECK